MQFSSMSTDIAKLQASVTLLVDHITASIPEPSSTFVVLSGSFTPSPQASLLPIHLLISSSQATQAFHHLLWGRLWFSPNQFFLRDPHPNHIIPNIRWVLLWWTPLSLPHRSDHTNITSYT
ncbi:hypothetical protein PRUPE_7G098600 [Prunus persica]|uniref:Uncharacterized protein n=1 Tax=Prunus persica TaxID=3760 RepID=A0A251NCH8_PRUPE|nr:hypothetical protein PRUPE_7G098600 [Prunus persica]